MKVRKGSISHALLLILEKTIDGNVRVEDFAYHHYRYHYGAPDLKKSALSEAIKRLREKGFIEKEIKDGKVILKLTNLGKEALGEPSEEWDGKVRIVIFDIPEKKRVVRDLLRRKLKNWGFKKWQLSVWITKRNVTEKLRSLISELGIEQWVAVIESDDPFLVHVMFNGRGTEYELK